MPAPAAEEKALAFSYTCRSQQPTEAVEQAIIKGQTCSSSTHQVCEIPAFLGHPHLYRQAMEAKCVRYGQTANACAHNEGHVGEVSVRSGWFQICKTISRWAYLHRSR